jgi:hypothetical protein
MWLDTFVVNCTVVTYYAICHVMQHEFNQAGKDMNSASKGKTSTLKESCCSRGEQNSLQSMQHCCLA